MRRPLTQADWLVWEPSLKVLTSTAESVTYQVPVGTEDAATAEVPLPLRLMWLTLRKKRIDVVVAFKDAIWIVEVKPWLRMSAVGQALCYRQLWMKENRNHPQVIPVVCCAWADTDVDYCAKALGVSVIRSMLMDAEQQELESLLDRPAPGQELPLQSPKPRPGQ